MPSKAISKIVAFWMNYQYTHLFWELFLNL